MALLKLDDVIILGSRHCTLTLY